MCVVAQAATIDALRKGLTLDEPTDEMECACPILRKMAIELNDGEWWKDNEERTLALRPLIPMLLDSRLNLKGTRRRLWFMCDEVLRNALPARMRWFEKKYHHPKVLAGVRRRLTALPEVSRYSHLEPVLQILEVARRAQDVDCSGLDEGLTFCIHCQEALEDSDYDRFDLDDIYYTGHAMIKDLKFMADCRTRLMKAFHACAKIQ